MRTPRLTLVSRASICRIDFYFYYLIRRIRAAAARGNGFNIPFLYV